MSRYRGYSPLATSKVGYRRGRLLAGGARSRRVDILPDYYCRGWRSANTTPPLGCPHPQLHPGSCLHSTRFLDDSSGTPHSHLQRLWGSLVDWGPLRPSKTFGLDMYIGLPTRPSSLLRTLPVRPPLPLPPFSSLRQEPVSYINSVSPVSAF